MSHTRIQDPISASFTAFRDTLAQIKLIFSEFLDFPNKWAYFETKMGYFWVENGIQTQNGFILSRPEIYADFETQPGNCWTWNSLLKPPSYETRAKFNSFWPQMT